MRLRCHPTIRASSHTQTSPSAMTATARRLAARQCRTSSGSSYCVHVGGGLHLVRRGERTGLRGPMRSSRRARSRCPAARREPPIRGSARGRRFWPSVRGSVPDVSRTHRGCARTSRATRTRLHHRPSSTVYYGTDAANLTKSPQISPRMSRHVSMRTTSGRTVTAPRSRSGPARSCGAVATHPRRRNASRARSSRQWVTRPRARGGPP